MDDCPECRRKNYQLKQVRAAMRLFCAELPASTPSPLRYLALEALESLDDRRRSRRSRENKP